MAYVGPIGLLIFAWIFRTSWPNMTVFGAK